MIADSLSMRERKSSMIDTIRPAHRCRRQQSRWRLNGLAMEINLPAHSRRSHSTRASDVKAIHIASFPINIDCWLVVHSSQITFTFKFSVSLSLDVCDSGSVEGAMIYCDMIIDQLVATTEQIEAWIIEIYWGIKWFLIDFNLSIDLAEQQRAGRGNSIRKNNNRCVFLFSLSLSLPCPSLAKTKEINFQ